MTSERAPKLWHRGLGGFSGCVVGLVVGIIAALCFGGLSLPPDGVDKAIIGGSAIILSIFGAVFPKVMSLIFSFLTSFSLSGVP